MTVGPDMPARSLKDAIVADTGKGHRLPDKKAAKGREDIPDFKSMLDAKPLRLPVEASDMTVGDDVSDIADDLETEKDKDPASAGPSVQAMVGQSILALEQLLDRQKQAGGDQPPLQHGKPLRIENFDAKLPDDNASGVIQNADEQLSSALPGVDRKAKSATSEKPDTSVVANTQAKPQPAKADAPQPQPVDAGSADPAAPKRASAKQAPEQAMTPAISNPAPVAPPAPPADPRITSATLADAAPAPQSRSPIADIHVVSDHSTSAARTLVIQLQPIELGTVTARLRLTGEGMHIQLMAESKAAAEHLARDHEALGKALQRAGVADDTSSVTISVVDRSATVASTQSGQQASTGQDPQTGSRAGGQANSGSQGTQGDRSSSQQHFGDSKADEREDKTAKAVADRNPSRGLVV
jgi:chemotaxis protein MotD